MPNMPNSVWVPSAKSSPLYSLAEEPPSVRENDLRFAISHFGHEFVTEAMQYGRASPSRGASGILQDVFEGNDSRLAMSHPPDDKASELATAWAMVMSFPDDLYIPADWRYITDQLSAATSAGWYYLQGDWFPRKKSNVSITQDALDRAVKLWSLTEADNGVEAVRGFIRANQQQFASRLWQRNAISNKPESERRIRSVFDFSYSGNIALARLVEPIKSSHAERSHTYILELSDPLSSAAHFQEELRTYRTIGLDIKRNDFYVTRWHWSQYADFAISRFNLGRSSNAAISAMVDALTWDTVTYVPSGSCFIRRYRHAPSGCCMVRQVESFYTLAICLRAGLVHWRRTGLFPISLCGI